MSKKGIKQFFTDSQYTPQYLSGQDVKVLSTDYTRLRDIMTKRYKRLQKQGFNTNFTRKVEMWGGEIPKLKDLKKEFEGDIEGLQSELAYWLSELKAEESSEETKVSYQKKERKKLHTALTEAGYELDITELDVFSEFMDYLRMTSLDRAFYTDTYRDSDTGYRSRRDERTAKEKDAINQAFNEWKKQKSFSLERQQQLKSSI